MDNGPGVKTVESLLNGFEFRIRKALRWDNCYYITLIDREHLIYKEFEFAAAINRNFDKYQLISKNHYFVELNSIMV